ncbi:MAG: hypothetical protein SFX74_07290 [Fimbriimonadaceae bacterium]|nr:hypothetical protein [Fimbriimonadaceae bacterium]
MIPVLHAHRLNAVNRSEIPVGISVDMLKLAEVHQREMPDVSRSLVFAASSAGAWRIVHVSQLAFSMSDYQDQRGIFVLQFGRDDDGWLGHPLELATVSYADAEAGIFPPGWGLPLVAVDRKQVRVRTGPSRGLNGRHQIRRDRLETGSTVALAKKPRAKRPTIKPSASTILREVRTAYGKPKRTKR